MRTVCDRGRCTGCRVCVNVCKKDAIFIKDSLSAMNAVIDEVKCVNCKMCEKVCPNNNPVDKVQPQKWYQGWVCKTREQSSSGGVAAGLTQNFIQNGGYVAACLFKDGEFVFDITNDLDYARKFAGSKYVKSNPKNIYSKIYERLKQGDRVLFIGLPCQVAALNNYIKDKKNLYTVDLICHGSPSPIILEKYLAENYVDIRKIKDLNFRNKDGFGLRSGYKRISFDDGSDLYTFAFLTSLDYTENCYSCRYATLDRVSDITLGDSWGSELEAEEQKKGISLILCQTEKGKELLKNTKIELRDVNLNKAVKANHQLSYPSKMPTERKIFFKNIDKGFYYAISRCHPKMYYIRRLKYILHKAKIIRGAVEIKIDMYDMTYKN